jgi:hypothetical protein
LAELSLISASTPAVPETTDALRIPTFAEGSASSPNARSAMNSDIVKPTPVRSEPAASTDHRKPAGRLAQPARTASQASVKTPSGFPITNPATTASATGLAKSLHAMRTPALASAKIGMTRNADHGCSAISRRSTGESASFAAIFARRRSARPGVSPRQCLPSG